MASGKSICYAAILSRVSFTKHNLFFPAPSQPRLGRVPPSHVRIVNNFFGMFGRVQSFRVAYRKLCLVVERRACLISSVRDFVCSFSQQSTAATSRNARGLDRQRGQYRLALNQ
jgi:hypothetical protein